MYDWSCDHRRIAKLLMMERSAQSCVSKREPIKLGFHQLTVNNR